MKGQLRREKEMESVRSAGLAEAWRLIVGNLKIRCFQGERPPAGLSGLSGLGILGGSLGGHRIRPGEVLQALPSLFHVRPPSMSFQWRCGDLKHIL